MKNLIKIIGAFILVFAISTPIIAADKKIEPVQPKMAPIAVKAPDLLVKEIKCGPGNKLQFTVGNIGSAPLPSGWRAVAEVFFDGRKMGSIDLGRPTSGDLTPAGGTASYLVVFDILRPVTVKVVVDATNSIRESNEANNTMTTKLQPCERVALPDLTVIGFSHDDREYVLMVTIKNLGPETVPATTGGVLQVFVDGTLVDTINLNSITVPSYPGQDFHKPGEATVVGTGWHFPPSKDFRNYNVCATIDATNRIAEANEANNRFCRMEQCPPH
jgi:archaellum component FlaG (FlaF/FlaG flagellin family)